MKKEKGHVSNTIEFIRILLGKLPEYDRSICSSWYPHFPSERESHKHCLIW